MNLAAYSKESLASSVGVPDGLGTLFRETAATKTCELQLRVFDRNGDEIVPVPPTVAMFDEALDRVGDPAAGSVVA